MKFNEGDTVFIVNWSDDDGLDTYRLLSFFESPSFGPSAHLIAISGTRTGQYRSIPLVNLRRPARLEKRGRGQWVVVAPDGSEMMYSSKDKALKASKKKNLFVKD